MHLSSLKANTYDYRQKIYERMLSLHLPPLDELRAIRFTGQHYYFTGNAELAVEIFSKADDLLRDSVPPESRSLFARRLGNILYLKGLALERLQDESATTENFIRMVSDPEVLANIPVVTSVSAYYRIGNLHYNDKQFAEAAQAYATGLKILQEAPMNRSSMPNRNTGSRWSLARSKRMSWQTTRTNPIFTIS